MKSILLAGMLALTTTSAMSHSNIDATTPENGAVLAEAPTQIILTFTKGIRLTQVRMTHDANDVIDLDLGDQTGFETRFELEFEGRGSGLYRIQWRGLSSDGHVVRNTFRFRVR